MINFNGSDNGLEAQQAAQQEVIDLLVDRVLSLQHQVRRNYWIMLAIFGAGIIGQYLALWINR